MKIESGRSADTSAFYIQCTEIGDEHLDEFQRQGERHVAFLARFGRLLEALDAAEEPEETRGKTAIACTMRAQGMIEMALESLTMAEEALAGRLSARQAGFPEFEEPGLED